VISGGAAAWLNYFGGVALNGKIEVICPHCGSSQQEPASGLSTYCRSCGGHIKMERTAPGGRRGLGGLMSMARGKQPPAAPPKAAAVPVRAPAMPLQITGYGEHDAPLVGQAASLSRPRPADGSLRENQRQVTCFECQTTHKVAGASTSTICPACSTYLDLRDIEIKDRTNQRIRTRGDVVVTKKGVLLGTSIHCGNLIIHGSVSGSIHAAGDVILKSDGKILGEIRCRRFVLERKCEVQCLQPVHAEVVEIHGRVSGNFHATRCITLSRHASLTGSATATTISVEPGAVLNGHVLVQPPEAKNGRALLAPGLVTAAS
jgi:cytoskeletal protein CcmA (bactofilin family)